MAKDYNPRKRRTLAGDGRVYFTRYLCPLASGDTTKKKRRSEGDFQQDYYIVNFKDIFSIPIILARKVAENNRKRLRLLPPYREHLSQAFARYFMRVGLPVDINFEEK